LFNFCWTFFIHFSLELEGWSLELVGEFELLCCLYKKGMTFSFSSPSYTTMPSRERFLLEAETKKKGYSPVPILSDDVYFSWLTKCANEPFTVGLFNEDRW
jgi:hypothetical protein